MTRSLQYIENSRRNLQKVTYNNLGFFVDKLLYNFKTNNTTIYTFEIFIQCYCLQTFYLVDPTNARTYAYNLDLINILLRNFNLCDNTFPVEFLEKDPVTRGKLTGIMINVKHVLQLFYFYSLCVNRDLLKRASWAHLFPAYKTHYSSCSREVLNKVCHSLL